MKKILTLILVFVICACMLVSCSDVPNEPTNEPSNGPSNEPTNEPTNEPSSNVPNDPILLAKKFDESKYSVITVTNSNDIKFLEKGYGINAEDVYCYIEVIGSTLTEMGQFIYFDSAEKAEQACVSIGAYYADHSISGRTIKAYGKIVYAGPKGILNIALGK